MKGKFIQITDEQEEFINNQRKFFKLSKFVRGKLDEYIEDKKMLESLK